MSPRGVSGPKGVVKISRFLPVMRFYYNFWPSVGVPDFRTLHGVSTAWRAPAFINFVIWFYKIVIFMVFLDVFLRLGQI